MSGRNPFCGLSRSFILYSEVEFMLRQELRETATYNAIIEAVALGNTKLNDIYQKTKMEKAKLSSYLKNLIDLGILCREFSVMDGMKEQANAARRLYRVTDPFFRFWYAFVFPNLSELEAGDQEGIWEYVIKPGLDQYTSYTFEEVCREYLRKQNRMHRLPFRFTKIGRWWNKTDELDLVATDAERKNYILGECKYRNGLFTYADLKRMQGKLTPANQEAQMYYYVFSKSGFTGEVLREREEGRIFAVTAEEVVLA